MDPRRSLLTILVLALLSPQFALGGSLEDNKLQAAARVMRKLAADPTQSIPAELLARAQGIAVIPDVLRGGFLLGGRRGKGALVVRSENGVWSNPTFITLTGGSIGWQIGVESSDIVLVFANKRSVAHINRGKFTLGGELAATAGPVGVHSAAAMTMKAEVYAYIRSRGLFAGAAFEGARINIDSTANRRFYRPGAEPLGEQSVSTPASARRFLLALEESERAGGDTVSDASPAEQDGDEVTLYPLGGQQ
jgi:lipid-binding SYLF domain-containing protein